MNESPFDLTGKIALVTGGGTGLGKGITYALAEANVKVIITGRREQVLKRTCEKYPERITYIINDITDLDSLPGLIDQIESDIGPIDILVNNAGINLKKHVLDVSDKDFDNILKTNLNGLYALSREAGRRMVKRKSGSIINITSMAAIYGIPQVTAYSASKTGVLGLTRSMAVDLSPHGVRVNAIAPGFIHSPMLEKAFNADPARKEKVLSRTPLNRLGSPEDVAYSVLFLASDAAKFITGVNLPVDGGNSIGF
jgi:NAD(P)-dependent dehydrogenase (short-subunit alcohol dehydrogenase family)